MQIYEDGCHCGRVRFRAEVDLELMSACNCSMCAKKGSLHLVVPPEQFTLLSGEDALVTYTFGTVNAQPLSVMRHVVGA